MKNFIIKIITFTVPFLIFILLVIFIDPYNFISTEKNQKIIYHKKKISKHLNEPLYKLINFSHNATDIIFLGDSRTGNIKESTFKKLTGGKATNLAYGGGTLPEIIESFWYVSKYHNLKEVYISINFDIYDKRENMNRVKKAIEIKESALSYFFNRYTFKSTFLILKSLIISKNNIKKTKLNKVNFWKQELEKRNNFYLNKSYPLKYFNQLSEISNYCKINKIKLVFFSPPTHISLQEKIKQFNLMSEDINFKKDLSRLGVYYDFDYPNDITENHNYYKDPFHATDSILEITINEIMSEKVKYAKNYKIN